MSEQTENMSETTEPALEEPVGEQVASEENGSGRSLRKRKLNLNRISSTLTCPLVCQFQYCGIRLADGDSLEWHYEGHLAQELERLKHVRVKKTPKDFPDRSSRRSVRDSAVERICRRRARRQLAAQAVHHRTLPSEESSAESSSNNETSTADLTCPVCDESVSEEEYSQHVDTCLATRPPSQANGGRHLEHDSDDLDEDPDDVDIDSTFGLETYTWAGQTRVRATSLVEGGLRGQGFVSITRGDEDAELDIEGDDDGGRKFGSDQYTEADLILPKPETKDEQEDIEARTKIQEVLLGQSSKTNSNEKTSAEDPPDGDDELDDGDLGQVVKRLRSENSELKQKSMCNICMDSYNRPVVSTLCWHVSCEECWLRALGSKKLCPQCKVIIQPKDLRRIFL